MEQTQRARIILYRQLTQVQHGQYGPMVAGFREAFEGDPDFVARACVHLVLGGSAIRDQQDSAVITLLQAPSDFPEYREASRCLLLGKDVYDIVPYDVPGLPPFRIFRIWQYMQSPVRVMRGNDEVGRYRYAREVDLSKLAGKLKVQEGQLRIEVDEAHRKSPRLMRGIMDDYRQMLEADQRRFEGVVLRNRRMLRHVYWYYRFPHPEWVDQILFQGQPPEGSRLAVLRQIEASDDPREQARLVVENRIPFPVAASVMAKVHPVVGVALLEVMTPTEALNARAQVERSGLLDVPEFRQEYERKVAQATASVASADYRMSAQGVDEGVQAAVEKAKEKAVQQELAIEDDLLVLMDISYSMQRVIAAVPRFVERIMPRCVGNSMLVAFNEYARGIDVEEPTLEGARRALRGVRAGGRTSIQAGLDYAVRKGFYPGKVVILTDGGENVGLAVKGLKNMEEQGCEPQIIILRFEGERDVLTPSLERGGYRFDRFEISGKDYYVFDQVAALLGGPPAQSLVQTILERQLPRRASWTRI